MPKKLSKFSVWFTLTCGLLFLSACLGENNHITNSTPKNASRHLMINEVLTSDALGGNDWIELYVTGDEPVYLADYSLIDNNEEHEAAPLADITMEPGEFLVIQATDQEPEDGSYYVPFKLGSHDKVTLYKGSEVIDELSWEDKQILKETSYGRLPDGSGTLHILNPTPGQANDDFLFSATRVTEIRLELNNEAWQAMLDNPLAEEYYEGSIDYNGIRLNNVAIRTKGNSSLMSVAGNPDSNRYSFKVDMNYYLTGQDLLGLQKLNLNNGFSDPTFMREYLSYNLMRALDLPTPRAGFVNLYINDEIFGLYTAVEQVDDEFIKAHFEQADGDLYKAGMGSDLLWKGDSIDNYPGMELKTNEFTSDNIALLAMLNELNNGGKYESVINVDAFLRYLAVSTTLVNLDSYQGQFAQNYYLYEENGIFTIIPWDFNMSFTGFNMNVSREQLIGLMIDEPTQGALEDRPLIDKLLQKAAYRKKYHGYLSQLINGPFSPQTMEQVIDETAELIRDSVYADPTKFYTFQEFEQALTDDLIADPNLVTIAGFGRAGSTIIGLKTFVNERVASISDQLNGLAPASGDGSGNGGGEGFPGGGPGGEPWGGFEDAISMVSPAFAKQGDMNLTVTITLDEQMTMLSPEINPLSVKIGTLEGRDIEFDEMEITAVFDIPIDEQLGMKDVSVEFPPPNGQPPGDFQPPGEFPPQGELPPPGEFQPPDGFPPQDGQNIIFSKPDAFEVKSAE